MQYFTIMPSSCIFQILGNITRWPLPLHLTIVHILILPPPSVPSFCFHMIYHSDYSCTNPFYSLLNIDAFSLIFLAAVLAFFPKTPSATSQIVCLKLFHPSSTLSNFKLSSLVFNCSWKVSLKFSSWSLQHHNFPRGSSPSKISALNP